MSQDNPREQDLGSNSGKTTEQPTKSEWTPEAVENLIKLVDTLAEKYITIKHDEAQALLINI